VGVSSVALCISYACVKIHEMVVRATYMEENLPRLVA
jgi:hypothetical protein